MTGYNTWRRNVLHGSLLRSSLIVPRAGARTAAIQDDAAAIRDAVTGAVPDLDPATLTVTVLRAGVRGDPVTVRVGYVSTVRVPLVGWLFGDGVTMGAEATDRQEFG